jgi:hypothetical protein
MMDIPNDHAEAHGETSLNSVLHRDQKYYKDDGDCVILVQDTLFKVHYVSP